MDKITVQKLVAETIAGDRSAFGQLVFAYERLVFGLIRQSVTNQSDIEDAAQETFLRAYRDMGRLKNTAAFGSWLGGIAIRVALEKAREASRTPRIDPSFEHSPGDAQSRAKEDELVRLLSELPVEYRLPLTLHYVDGLKYSSIAAMLGLTESNARTLVHRARAILKSKLSA